VKVKALKASSRVRLDFADVESVGATFLDTSLGALVERHCATVLRSIVFTHCSTRIEASIVKALSRFCLKSLYSSLVIHRGNLSYRGEPGYRR